MEKFTRLEETAVPLEIENVDTDQIIPARFLKATDRKGFGDNLFHDWDLFFDKVLNKADQNIFECQKRRLVAVGC